MNFVAQWTTPSIGGGTGIGGGSGTGGGTGTGGGMGIGGGSGAADAGNADAGIPSGVYVGVISFAGGALDINNDNLVRLDASGLQRILSNLDNRYTRSAQSGTALFYAVHKAIAALSRAELTLPPNTDSISIVTFTDGLDNGSFGASNIAPIENMIGTFSSDYKAYVTQQIGSRQIKGKHISAHSVGIAGNDVVDIDDFNQTLRSISSTDAGARSLASFHELESAFTEIAENLSIVHSTTDFSMITTANDPGTLVRMTFDVIDTSSASADASTRYLQGRLGYDAGTYWLRDIAYGSGLSSASGTQIMGSQIGSEVVFLFRDIRGYSSQTDTPKQWFRTHNSTNWQINSEYDAGGSTLTTIEQRSAVVYLVLDSSTSLSASEIEQIRDAAKSFVQNLYTQAQP